MHILQSVPLKLHSTMRLGGMAAYLCEISTKHELREALDWADARQLPVMMIGGGSNIIWKDEGFSGLIMVNKIPGSEYIQDDGSTLVTIGAGENWDEMVERTVDLGLSGIEALSLIPGTSGATPVQNVGAYGQEISQTLESLEAYDQQAKQFVTLPGDVCAFGYRTSRFKTHDRGRFFITSITLRLTGTRPRPPFYGALQRYFDQHDIRDYTPATVRQAVIAIRRSKLPDPAKVANNGSFFANPIVAPEVVERIRARHPEVPHWPTPDGRCKLPAAWLLEQAGFKDIHDQATGMATWHAQPLVLVNEHARSTSQLLAFKHEIVMAVQEQFGITLQQEPELLP